MATLTRDEVLAQVKAAFGFVPNLLDGIAAQSPTAAAVYLAGSEALGSAKLTPAERQVVMLAVSAFNDCHYCTAAHRTVAKSQGVPQAELDAIDAQEPPSDPRLQQLVDTVWTLQQERGWLSEARRADLGISLEEVYEIIAILGLKTMTNYINHIQHTEIDAPFQAQATRSPQQAA